MSADQFRTMTGYLEHQAGELSATMEDYLEMICRLTKNDGYARISRLAELLQVKPSSASKMAAQLRRLGYIEYANYSAIQLTEKGQDYGAYLLHRHQVLESFLCLLNKTENETEQVELIEHFIRPQTIANLEQLSQILLTKQIDF